MTKLIIYVLTVYLTGVMFFYIAIIWKKGVSYILKKKAAKLDPKINGLITRYIELYLIINGTYKNESNNQYNIDKKILHEKSFIVSKLGTLVKKTSQRKLLEDCLFTYNVNENETTHKAISKLSEEIGLVREYIKALHLKDHHKVAEAVEKIGKMGSNSANEYLIKVLKRGNTFESYNTLLALAKIGDEQYFIKAFDYLEGIEYLTHRSLIHIIDSFQGDLSNIYCIMINHSNSYIASLFIKSARNTIHNYSNKLNEVTINHIKTNIISYLNSRDNELKIATIKFLGELKDDRLIDKIAVALFDEEWEVRAITAKVLGNFYDGAQEYLLKAVRDDVWTVRYNAAFSLIKTHNYLNYVNEILCNDDKFAKDIIIAVLDNTKKINDIQNESILEKITQHIKITKGND